MSTLKGKLPYAQQGTITTPHLADQTDQTDQTDQAWCLTVLTNAVITWTTEYYHSPSKPARRWP
ncbi:hypothetical protein [Nonomuraea sp. NPDC049625]|uniref:hypothetical protein n=1 Tax=Nonomuraea sp. NPDC049625 TaxID=3155775 RepID=UPI003443E6C4